MKKSELRQLIREEILEFGMNRIKVKDIYKNVKKGDTIKLDSKTAKVLDINKNEIKTDKGSYKIKDHGSGPDQWELEKINGDPILVL